MKLTIVGCAGSYPGPDSAASCYLVEHEVDGRVWRILFDLGSGAFGALQRYCDPLTIDAVFLSHLHPDHCIDMTGFYVMRKYNPAGHQGQVPVYGSQGVADRLARAYDTPADPGMHKEFEFHHLADHLGDDGGGRAITIGPFAVLPIPVVHPVEAYGFRVEAAGQTMAYTGDTGECDSLARLALGVDLLLAEASYVANKDNKPGVHLTGAQAGAVATAGAVGQLVLTHVPAWHDSAIMQREAAEVYAGPLSLARAGATYLF
jgi:ribonuclease BN (tRNA processing enzyme)